MPLVEMADVRLNAQREEHAPAADTQHHFLNQTEFGPSVVEFTRNTSVERAVELVVAVQQV